MEQCKCPNCGAPINTARMICEYCGTTFKEQKTGPLYKPEYKIVLEKPGVKVLGAAMIMDRDMMMLIKDHDDLQIYVKERLANVMASKLMDMIEVQYRENYFNNSVECRARLRVLDQEYKF